MPTSWSADGRSLLYTIISPKTGIDLWGLPMAGDPKPWSFLNSTFSERTGAFSPDGHWVAYQSDESGRVEIYVRPFPGPGGQWQISTAGGKAPRWRPDGTALYYIAPDSRLMAAPIASSGTALQPGLPTALFQPRIALGGTPGDWDPAAIRRRTGRPLPDQRPRGGEHRRADHGDHELASRGEEVNVALTPGSRLGVYQITAPLGEGGMGQVWRARDMKLDRDVAIKVRPEAFAHDADRLSSV